VRKANLPPHCLHELLKQNAVSCNLYLRTRNAGRFHEVLAGGGVLSLRSNSLRVPGRSAAMTLQGAILQHDVFT
jgi:hypothetical protein